MQNIDMRIVIVLLFVALVIYTVVQNKRQLQKRMLTRLKKNWGVKPEKKISTDDYEKVSHMYKNSNIKDGIDDITWNDLNMDEVFKTINNTNSSVGQEYLYRRLRNSHPSRKELQETDRLAEFFGHHEKERLSVQKVFYKLGFVRLSVSDYVDLLMDLEVGNNIIHYLALLLLVIAVPFCVFYNPVIGIWAIIAAIAFSVITYYKFKARVEHYFVCVNQIVGMLAASESMERLGISELEEYNQKLRKLVKAFDRVTKNAAILDKGNVSGSISEVIAEYMRMITHIDLIKFNHIVKILKNKNSEVHEMMDTLGFIESSIAVASFREMLPYWSVPELIEENSGRCKLEIKEAFHPLIEKPVANSISTKKHILLTGSNASGKSTFLKTIAINAILSQTINTSMSKGYRAPIYRIYSSMALKDDLSNSNSYYIVEIKSLKRILDAVDEGGTPVLCFIDEVLRGTNTVERIAASSEILKNISNYRALCFAATHDVELTKILLTDYENYHFQEEVDDKNVLFNFKLFSGPATTRNAIKLLDMIGYKSSIISGAERKARYFLDNGAWDC